MHPSPASMMVASTIKTDDRSTEELQKRIDELLDENKTLKQNNESIKEQFLMIAARQEDIMRTRVVHNKKFDRTQAFFEKLSKSSEEMSNRDQRFRQLEGKLAVLQQELKNSQLKILDLRFANLKLKFSKYVSGVSEAVMMYRDLNYTFMQASPVFESNLSWTLRLESTNNNTSKYFAELFNMMAHGMSDSFVQTLDLLMSVQDYNVEKITADQLKARLTEAKKHLEKQHSTTRNITNNHAPPSVGVGPGSGSQDKDPLAHALARTSPYQHTAVSGYNQDTQTQAMPVTVRYGGGGGGTLAPTTTSPSRTAPLRPFHPIHSNVKFNKLPFYDVLAVLMKPSTIMPMQVGPSQENTFTFYLTPQQASEITIGWKHRDDRVMGTGGDVQVQLRFCLLDISREQEDQFPPSVIVKVNNKMCQLPRYPVPVDISSLVKLCPAEENTIHVTWESDFTRAYVLGVFMVQKRTTAVLLQRLQNKSAKNPDYTRSLIKEELSKECHSEIALTSLRVSLLCPLVKMRKMRMSLPCRAATCRHLQCFDASVFLQRNERKPTWRCPVCERPAPYDSLVVDGYFMEVLSSSRLLPDCDEIDVHADGNWSVHVISADDERSIEEYLSFFRRRFGLRYDQSRSWSGVGPRSGKDLQAPARTGWPARPPGSGYNQDTPAQARYGGGGGATLAPMTSPTRTAPLRPFHPVHSNVKLNKLPFYDVLAVLMKPSTMKAKQTGRMQKGTYTFHLTPEQAAKITSRKNIVGTSNELDYDIQVQLRFCLLDVSREQEDQFPPSVIVKVNNKVCQLPMPIPTNNPTLELNRPPGPVNISSLVKLSPTEKNTIHVTWESDVPRAYALGVFMVQKLTPANLVQRLKNINSDYTRTLIKEKLSKEYDSEIAVTSLRVSLLCPLGRMRMSHPCRAATCRHLQCFDALVFLQINERKPTWLCPVCDRPAPYDSLVVDRYFLNVLASQLLPDCDEIEVHADGKWSAEASQHTQPTAKTVISNDDDDLDVILVESNNGSKKRLADMVVDLTLDSD